MFADVCVSWQEVEDCDDFAYEEEEEEGEQSSEAAKKDPLDMSNFRISKVRPI